MKYILLNIIDDFPEDLLFAKVDVEKKLIEDNIIEKRFRIDEFIIYLNVQNNIYLKEQKGIAFRYIQGKNDDYIFYNFIDEEDPELFESFKRKVESLKFDFSSLTKASNLDMIQEGFLNNEIFMINFNIYK